jgi:hypothetical protein
MSVALSSQKLANQFSSLDSQVPVTGSYLEPNKRCKYPRTSIIEYEF